MRPGRVLTAGIGSQEGHDGNPGIGAVRHRRHRTGQHVARFGDIAGNLQQWQPPALMLWGRHDRFFDLAETLSWMKALPRMEAHVLDGPHFLLETHADERAALMGAFLARVEAAR